MGAYLKTRRFILITIPDSHFEKFRISMFEQRVDIRHTLYTTIRARSARPLISGIQRISKQIVI